jgi:uncharacterized protein (UPF0332 family)
MIAGTKEDYIEYRILKSKEIFDDAKLLANNQRWNSCMNRLYYSSYYLVSALLYQNDFKSETHNGTKTQFNFHYIKTGHININYGKLYSNLFEWRQESDYADFVDFDAETVLPLIREVEKFNYLIEEIIRK